ncbi:hypothetical protein F4560_001962 [Saccharothrix ecbatanensis]|uniref:Uncharacterized protein n=1 Tax=Saccharothrix ecbatanensis TaxID=1105145 RepID=A0A7W9HI01_9PSEU|nr:hypothetical protein [Saccharothrix ecbatanensis]MBB5802194.1 hypothetical protein [Saccharothrix ecbatanensis]
MAAADQLATIATDQEVDVDLRRDIRGVDQTGDVRREPYEAVLSARPNAASSAP